jgi:hypothetical protein
VTSELSVVVLAHRDAPQVRRLIRTLDNVPVSLHCDVKAPAAVAAEMSQGWGSRVQLLPRSSGALNSWSLVRIELDALRAALRHSAAAHIAVLSGADYPLVGVQELVNALAPWAGRSYLLNRPVPFEHWSVPRHPDGGRWRTAHRFLTRGDDLLTIKGVPVRFPWKRRLPAGLSVRASSQWKIYAREDAQLLLDTLDRRPDLVRFWRSTLVPDESCAASVLSSPRLTGGRQLPECHGSPWYIKWGARGSHHPEWLTADDYGAITDALAGPPGDPVLLERPVTARPRPLFARKMSSEFSAALLDRIDAELH